MNSRYPLDRKLVGPREAVLGALECRKFFFVMEIELQYLSPWQPDA
jgi:hypothetical protein